MLISDNYANKLTLITPKGQTPQPQGALAQFMMEIDVIRYLSRVVLGDWGNGGLGDGIMELKWQVVVSPSSGVGVYI